MRLLLLLLSCSVLSGCGLWPYKSDFDCPIPEGEHCNPLYEINKLADSGKYSPETGGSSCCTEESALKQRGDLDASGRSS